MRAEGFGSTSTSFDYDVIVVGSGFGGSVSALRLTEKGYRVAVLEMGKRYHAEDFPKTNWDIRRSLWRPEIGCYGIMQMTLLRDVFVLHGAGVGGGSLVYANTLLVPSDAAFENAGWVGKGWKERLAPHYETAKRMLGVVEAPEIYEGDRALLAAATEMGRGAYFRKTSVGVFFGEPGKVVPDPYFGGEGPERAGCIRCGGCMVGCRYNAKNTLDKNYLYLAEKRGAQVLPERRVTAIDPLPGGGYELTVQRTTSFFTRKQKLRARKVVLSAGVLGTVPLLMRCKAEGRLPHLSDRLGDRVRTNSETLLAVRARKNGPDLGGKGIAIAAGVDVDAHTHVEVVRYNPGSDFFGLLSTVLTDGDGGPWRRRLRWVGQILRHPIEWAKNLSPIGWAERTALLLVMQPIENYLRLRYARRPLFFKRGLRSERATSDPIPVYFPVAHELARRMAAHTGGVPQSSNLEIIANVPTTAHILGGCPMGTSAENGVIDDQCRVFGYEGLYVIDGSAIPANLGVNPSLTITALAEYAMSRFPSPEAA